MSEHVNRIKKLFDQAKAKREHHESEIRSAYKMTNPSRQSFEHEEKDSPDRTKLYDSTAVAAVQDLTTSVIRMLIPHNAKWAELVLKEEVNPNAIARETKVQIDAVNNIMHQTLRESNFYIAAGESIMDSVITGTGCMALLEDDRGIHFCGVPVGQIYFLEDYKGEVDSVFRQHKMNARQIVARWGDKVPANIKEEAVEKPNQQHTVLESQIPVTGTKKVEYSVHITKSSDTIHNKEDWPELDKREIERNRAPFIVFRWNKTVGEVWGEGPIRYAIANIRVINELMKDIEMFSEYAAFGLWQTQTGAINPRNYKQGFKAGSIIQVDEPLAPVDFPGDLRVAQAVLEDHRAQVREITANTELPPANENPYMTATEVLARREQFFRRVGQPALRLQREFLVPIAQQVIARLTKRGAIPDVLNDEVDILEIKVQSAAERGIKLSEVQNEINTFLQLMQVLSTMGEQGIASVGKRLNVDAFVKKVFEDSGFSPELIRSDDEVEALEQQETQIEQAQQALGAAEQIADIGQKAQATQQRRR